jgi:hypothetical protein
LVAHQLALRVGESAVFLPFCDTDEENLVAPRQGERLFQLDRERLRRLDGMIAVVHGPSLDDGVCMEIGYARQLGTPVVLLTTDFQSYGLWHEAAQLAFPDPLLEAVATDLIQVQRLGAPCAVASTRFEAFLACNIGPLREAADAAVQALLRHPPVGPRLGENAPADVPRMTGFLPGPPGPVVFLEPSPYQPAHTYAELAEMLLAQGCEIREARRLADTSASRDDLIATAQADWAALGTASLLVVDVNGPEAPPGAALLIGASSAAQQRVFALYSDRSWTFAPGREPNFRNLMIQYSIEARFRTLDELTRLLLT